MIWKKSLQQIGTLSVALLLGWAIAPRFNSRAEAQSQPDLINPNLSSPWLVSQAFQPPDRGAPPTTSEGGSRGCGQYQTGQKFLTALTPSNYLPLTLGEYPTFFWYVPQSTGQTLEFTLRDEKDVEVVYKTTFPAPSTPGIISFSLPAGKSAPLKVGKMYHWYLAMICDPQDRTGDAVIEGWIERTAPSQSLAQELKNASPSDRPSIYAKAGIWHESLASLAALRQNKPQDSTIVARWEELLNSVQLGQFAKEPIVERSQTSQK